MNIVKWYKNRSFQFKLVIGYLVLALIPMLCVTWYSYGKTRNVLLTEAYQSAEQEAERIEKNFSTMVEPYETILDVLYVDQMLSGYLFQDYSNDSYEDMFYYIDKKLSEICLMNAGIYKICFYSNNETLPQDNYYFYFMQDLDQRERVLTFDAIGETVFSRSFFADSSYMLSFSVLCSCVCSRLISPSVSSWHKQNNTLMHQSPGHIQRRTPYSF